MAFVLPTMDNSTTDDDLMTMLGGRELTPVRHPSRGNLKPRVHTIKYPAHATHPSKQTSTSTSSTKIITYGQSFLAGSPSPSLCVLMAVRAPEILLGEASAYRSDLWSLRCMVSIHLRCFLRTENRDWSADSVGRYSSFSPERPLFRCNLANYQTPAGTNAENSLGQDVSYANQQGKVVSLTPRRSTNRLPKT